MVLNDLITKIANCQQVKNTTQPQNPDRNEHILVKVYTQTLAADGSWSQVIEKVEDIIWNLSIFTTRIE